MKWILAIAMIMTIPELFAQEMPSSEIRQFLKWDDAATPLASGCERDPGSTIASSDQGTVGRKSGGIRVSTMENKRIAESDVLNVGPGTLTEKLSHYAENATVWDSVMRVLGFSESNKVSGIQEVKKFFTWLAGLPPVKVKILNVFGEGEKVTVEWMLSGGEGAQKFEIPCANIYDFEKGKIKSVRMHFDSAFFADIVKK